MKDEIRIPNRDGLEERTVTEIRESRLCTSQNVVHLRCEDYIPNSIADFNLALLDKIDKIPRFHWRKVLHLRRIFYVRRDGNENYLIRMVRNSYFSQPMTEKPIILPSSLVKEYQSKNQEKIQLLNAILTDMIESGVSN